MNIKENSVDNFSHPMSPIKESRPKGKEIYYYSPTLPKIVKITMKK